MLKMLLEQLYSHSDSKLKFVWQMLRTLVVEETETLEKSRLSQAKRDFYCIRPLLVREQVFSVNFGFEYRHALRLKIWKSSETITTPASRITSSLQVIILKWLRRVRDDKRSLKWCSHSSKSRNHLEKKSIFIVMLNAKSQACWLVGRPYIGSRSQKCFHGWLCDLEDKEYCVNSSLWLYSRNV